MKRRIAKQKAPVEDTRKVAIYARKSVITHKGDSTGVQIKQCSDYASSQLSLPDDYDFSIYTDKGLSGYYSDRPDFQRMLHDIEENRIRAVACYKLDRISRKTSDLMSLLDFFDRHHVVLLVCSNNINTSISTSKIMISFLAIIAEFERDILTERVTDNLYELAKDGRWMGGLPPTGYERYRITVGTGRNKTAVTHLKTIPDEKKLVVEIYQTFLKLHSMNKTRVVINEKYKTKNGNSFRIRAIKDILSNPIYCIADKDAFQFFYDQESSICADEAVFDGKHGVSSYNRHMHSKTEDDDSTFFRPKFSTRTGFKDINEWLITIGTHEGFISGKEWVQTQVLLEEIANHYNRPHNASLALLGGKVYCPQCGSRLHVLAQSGRFNPDGTQRFHYGCPKHAFDHVCEQMPVKGQELDLFVVDKLSEIADKTSKYYAVLMNKKVIGSLQSDSSAQELAQTLKDIKRIEGEIAAQVRNLRLTTDSIRPLIEADIEELSGELQEKKALSHELEKKAATEDEVSEGLQEVRDKLINFGKLISGCSYEERLGIVQSIVDRVIVRTENGMQVVHVFVKGNLNDTYDDFYDESNGSTEGDQETSENTESEVVASALGTGEGKMYNQEQYRQHHSHDGGNRAPRKVLSDHETAAAGSRRG